MKGKFAVLFNSKRVNKDYIGTIVALLLVPLILLVALYVSVYIVVQQQIQSYAELTADYFHVQATSMFHEMEIVGNDLLHNSEIYMAMTPEIEEGENTAFICNIMRNAIEQSSYVEHVYLICPEAERIYSDEGLYNIASLDSILRKLNIPSDTFPRNALTEKYVLNGDSFSPYYIMNVNDFNGNYIGSILVNLDVTAFRNIFFSLNAECCVIYNKYVAVSSYLKKIDHFDWGNQEQVEKLLGNKVTCVYLEDEDYTYMVAIDRRSYVRPLHLILYCFIVYAVVILGVGLLHMYKQTKNWNEHVVKLLCALPSTYDGDMDYANVFEKIRVSILEYRNNENKYMEIMGKTNLYNIITAVDGENIDEYKNKYWFEKVGFEKFYVAAFFYDLPTEFSENNFITTKKELINMIELLFHSTMEELVKRESNMYFETCCDHRVQVAILWGEKRDNLEETIERICHNATDILLEGCNVRLTVSISSPVDCPEKFASAYREATAMHQFARTINTKAQVVSVESFKQNGAVLLTGEFIRKEQILINTILARKYTAVPDMCENILENHVSCLKDNYGLAQKRLMSVINILEEGIRIAEVGEFDKTLAIQSMVDCITVEELVGCTKQIYGELAMIVDKEDGFSHIFEVAARYIKHNLSDQNLNVSMICDAVGISSQKLTRIFNSTLGMAVAEYVNYCRIEKAKELLAEADITAVAISAIVGYSNTDTFTRNFKKLEGITPSEYRRGYKIL